MYSPRLHRVSHTMQRKQNKNKNKSKSKPQQRKQQHIKATPFKDSFGIMGKAAGNKLNSMFSTNMDLTGVGQWLGSSIGWIFGSGDYQIAGGRPENNVLFNSRQVPQFSSTRATNIVCHREYLTDWTGVTNFAVDQYKLNPGDGKTFPWLSTVAQNYSQYKFHGLIFEFRPLITDFVTNGSPGVVIMATNYNADDGPYLSKHEMENTEFAVSVKPTMNLVHGVECAASETMSQLKNIRTGALASGIDPNLYDLGTFNFGNQGSPNQLIGEIWVSYCVEFFKPVIPETIGGQVDSAFSVRSGIAGATPLGTTQLQNKGNMNLVVTSTTLSFDAVPTALYLVSISWTGAAIAVTMPTITDTALFNVAAFFPGGTGIPTSGTQGSPPNGVTAASANLTGLYVGDGTSPGRASIIYGTAGSIPVNNCTIFITRLDDSAVPPLP